MASYPPGHDPSERTRPDLTPVRGPREPVGYQAGWQIEERLQGLLVVVLGLVGLLGIYGVVQIGGLPGTTPPPGLLVAPLLLNATSCLLPLVALGSIGLILVGIRRILDP